MWVWRWNISPVLVIWYGHWSLVNGFLGVLHFQTNPNNHLKLRGTEDLATILLPTLAGNHQTFGWVKATCPCRCSYVFPERFIGNWFESLQCPSFHVPNTYPFPSISHIPAGRFLNSRVVGGKKNVGFLWMFPTKSNQPINIQENH